MARWLKGYEGHEPKPESSRSPRVATAEGIPDRGEESIHWQQERCSPLSRHKVLDIGRAPSQRMPLSTGAASLSPNNHEGDCSPSQAASGCEWRGMRHMCTPSTEHACGSMRLLHLKYVHTASFCELRWLRIRSALSYRCLPAWLGRRCDQCFGVVLLAICSNRTRAMCVASKARSSARSSCSWSGALSISFWE